jgi:outer membrane protein
MESTQKQVAAQEVAVQGTTQEMAAGTKIMFDVLNAQSQLLQAKLDLITAIQNYYTYFYQMLSLQGKLTATGLELPVEIFHPEQNYNEIKNNF